ncbi:hypothetical protein PR048_029105 [Dryococelus australis]|uniref:Uncharacterized protein n=1 Tax=Dryococelus australis TaxID=614101 RepID=A0ABQ9GCS9_9NEOP|nr:hypothetical protein PR048_029105 [Dryococelus australis]
MTGKKKIGISPRHTLPLVSTERSNRITAACLTKGGGNNAQRRSGKGVRTVLASRECARRVEGRPRATSQPSGHGCKSAATGADRTDYARVGACYHRCAKLSADYDGRENNVGREEVRRCKLFTRECKGGGEYPEKTRRQAASSSTIPTCENPGVNPSGIGPRSPWWEASALIEMPPVKKHVHKLGHVILNRKRGRLIQDTNGPSQIMMSVAAPKGGGRQGHYVFLEFLTLAVLILLQANPLGLLQRSPVVLQLMLSCKPLLWLAVQLFVFLAIISQYVPILLSYTTLQLY